ncbi:hypothetical protein TW85_22430, partial [Marinomonas sp. S3726]|uniref:hypothetical protein n=1 Tax=Marinomonas sp. S3726 TaxID=579484 RepID=UPI0005FA42B8
MIIEKSDGFLDTSLKMTNREALYWLYKSADYKSLIPKNPIIVVNKESNELAQKIRNNVRVETEFEKIITQVKTNMIPLNQLSWIKSLNIEEVIYLDKLISNLSTNRGYRSSVFSTTDD